MRAVQSLESHIAAGEDSLNTVEIRDRKKLDKISEFRTLVLGLSWTVSVEHARVAELVSGELVCVRSVVNKALLESKGTVSGPIWGV